MIGVMSLPRGPNHHSGFLGGGGAVRAPMVMMIVMMIVMIYPRP
jgi:hypothetical protein